MSIDIIQLEEISEIVNNYLGRLEELMELPVKDLTEQDKDFLVFISKFEKPRVDSSNRDPEAIADYETTVSKLLKLAGRYNKFSTIENAVESEIKDFVSDNSLDYNYMVNWQIMKNPKPKYSSSFRTKVSYMSSKGNSKSKKRNELRDANAKKLANKLCSPVIGGIDMSRRCGTLENLLFSHYLSKITPKTAAKKMYNSIDEMPLRYKLDAIKNYAKEEFTKRFTMNPGNITIHFKSFYAEEMRRLYFSILNIKYAKYKDNENIDYYNNIFIPVEREGKLTRGVAKISLASDEENIPDIRNNYISKLTQYFCDTYTDYLEFREYLSKDRPKSGSYTVLRSSLQTTSVPVFMDYESLLYKTKEIYYIVGAVSDDIVNPYIIFDNFVSDKILLRDNKYNWDIRIHSNEDITSCNGIITKAHEKIYSLSDIGLEKWKKNSKGVRAEYPSTEAVFIMTTKQLCALLGTYYVQAPTAFYSKVLRRALPFDENSDRFILMPGVDEGNSIKMIIDEYNSNLQLEASHRDADKYAILYSYKNQEEMEESIENHFNFLYEDDRTEEIETIKSLYIPQSLGAELAFRLDKLDKLSGVNMTDFAENIDYISNQLIKDYNY